jgi:hypothetical protein
VDAAGSTSNNIVAARESLLAWTVVEVEKIVGDDEAPAVEGEIAETALGILIGRIAYKPFVKILGCTKPTKSDRASTPLRGTAKWGETTGKTRRADVKTAMLKLEELLEHVWGDAAGCGTHAAGESAFGLAELADDAMVLDDAGAEKIFNTAFTRIDAACRRMRTRAGADKPDWHQEVQLAKKAKLEPLVTEMITEANARATARAAAAEFIAEYEGSPAAGVKRKIEKESAAKTARAAAAAAEAATAGTGAGPLAGRAKAPTRAEKRAARNDSFKLSKATADEDEDTEPTAAQAVAAAFAAKTGTPKFGSPPPVIQTRIPKVTFPKKLTEPTFLKDSITDMVDKVHHRGAVEAFEFLYRQRVPDGPLPCGFAALATCRSAPKGECDECAAQAALVAAGKAKTVIPDGIVAKVKAACNTKLADRINA